MLLYPVRPVKFMISRPTRSFNFNRQYFGQSKAAVLSHGNLENAERSEHTYCASESCGGFSLCSYKSCKPTSNWRLRVSHENHSGTGDSRDLSSSPEDFLVSWPHGLPRRNDGNPLKEFWTACYETQVGVHLNECLQTAASQGLIAFHLFLNFLQPKVSSLASSLYASGLHPTESDCWGADF